MRNRSTLSAGVVFLVALFLSQTPSWGWNSTGHKVVAMVAWEDLTPKTRGAITAILKQHARYEKDLQSGAEDGLSADQMDRHAFAQAATWPDMVRSQDNPMHVEYNHPAWHYIDIPYVVPTTQPSTQLSVKPVDGPADGPGPHNIVEALTQCVAELKDPKTPPAKQAVDLCWVEHLIGDIHQPLHAVSMYSAQFPNGDQGGNAEVILREPPYPDSQTKLHSLWDSLAGNFMSDTLDSYEARGMREDPALSREKLKDLLNDTDFMSWAKQSHDLAVKDVYLDGNLHTALAPRGRRGGGGGGDSIPGSPPGYLQNSEKLAMHQVALAGYRLADVLNGIFDSK